MNRKAVFATIFAVLLALAPAAGMAGATAAPAGGTDATDTVSFEEGVTDAGEPVEFGAQGDVDDVLRDAEGTTEVMLRLDEIDRRTLQEASGQAAVSALKSHAAATQQNLLRYAGSTDGVELVERFWITNAVLVEVDTDQVDIEELTRIKGVDRAHPNFELSLPPAPEGADAGSSDVGSAANDTTYGLDTINASEVWSEYGTQGGGAEVAVLDTGVDGDHPDIDIEGDNFVNVTETGVQNVEPYDDEGHGTHTSGTIVGSDDPEGDVSAFGVAPEATLYHGKVLDSQGGGSIARIIQGIEWATEEDVDAISMSLGASSTTTYYPEMIDIVENARDAGSLLVASVGNVPLGGTPAPGYSGSPGNYYSSLGVGATDDADEVAEFSLGENIDTEAAWGDDAPEDWPEEYTTPAVSAPGVSVLSAQPGGEYTELSGTSMSAPHVAGTVALMMSVSDIEDDTAFDVLEDTAWKPDGADAPEDERDNRYGSGIVDAAAAVESVVSAQTVNGTVTDADGAPIEGATVSIEDGASSSTNASGAYSLFATNGTHEVTADAFGYAASTETVTIDGSDVTQDFSLDASLDVELTDGQPEAIMGGENASVTVNAANLESYTAELGDGYSEDDATLYVDGEVAEFGEPVTFDEPIDGTVTVSVETTEDTSGDVSVTHTFEGPGDSVEMTTGPTEVFETLMNVGVVDDDGSHGADVAGTLEGELPGNYQFDVIDSDTAIDSTDEYDAYVVQQIDSSNAEAFTDATANYDVGTVYLDQWGGNSNGIEARSAALGDPADTGQTYDGGPPTYLNTADHPIFDGTGDGPITLHEATLGADRMWFSDTDADVLADVGSGPAVDGSGVAVSEARWDVLAATLGRSGVASDDVFTEDADTILGNMVEFAVDTPDPAGTVSVTDTTVSPGSTASVALETDVSDVAGYETTIEFDPEKLQVEDISGEDMADPVMEVDNENGELFVTQAQAQGVDAPELAEIEFEVVGMQNGDEADVTLSGEESAVYDPAGDAYLTNWDNGHVSVLEGDLGDVNADGEITAGDAVIVQRYIAGLPTDVSDEQIEVLGDVNQDGQITSADVTYILQIVAGIEEPPEMSALDSQPSVATPDLESTAGPSAAAL